MLVAYYKCSLKQIAHTFGGNMQVMSTTSLYNCLSCLILITIRSIACQLRQVLTKPLHQFPAREALPLRMQPLLHVLYLLTRGQPRIRRAGGGLAGSGVLCLDTEACT